MGGEEREGRNGRGGEGMRGRELDGMEEGGGMEWGGKRRRREVSNKRVCTPHTRHFPVCVATYLAGVWKSHLVVYSVSFYRRS